MQRDDVEQRLLHRHPDLPAGVVLGVVGRAARRLSHTRAGGSRAVDVDWAEVEKAAEEQLLLRQVVRLHGAGLADGGTAPGLA